MKQIVLAALVLASISGGAVAQHYPTRIDLYNQNAAMEAQMMQNRQQAAQIERDRRMDEQSHQSRERNRAPAHNWDECSLVNGCIKDRGR